MSIVESNRPWLNGLAVFGIATGIGLLFAAEMYVTGRAFGHGASWLQCVYWGLGDWYEWALLWPLILWLARRVPLDRRHWATGLLLHLLAGTVIATAHVAMCALAEGMQMAWAGKPWEFHESFRHTFARFQFNLAIYALFVAGAHAVAYYRDAREREAQAARLAQQLAEAELSALRMQLNPHFLFNALNAVSSLMLRDITAANRMLARLAELLRLTLNGSRQQETALEEELAFTRRYLDVEQVRFGDRLKVEIHVPSETLAARVPALLLQPLVENAMKHAVTPSSGTVTLSIKASRDNGSLSLEVSDSGSTGAPLSPAFPGHGIGLANTRQRLQQLYGNKQQLSLTREQDGGTVVRITLPCRFGAAERNSQ
jgi:two-component system LytT family sensor kinase